MRIVGKPGQIYFLGFLWRYKNPKVQNERLIYLSRLSEGSNTRTSARWISARSTSN